MQGITLRIAAYLLQLQLAMQGVPLSIAMYLLELQLVTQGIPLTTAMYLLQLQAIYIVDEPLIAAADVKEVRGYIFGFLRSLTAIAPYCGLREHLILHACMCSACHLSSGHVPSLGLVSIHRDMQAYAAVICHCISTHSQISLQSRSLCLFKDCVTFIAQSEVPKLV